MLKVVHDADASNQNGYVNLKWPQGDGLKWPHVISS